MQMAIAARQRASRYLCAFAYVSAMAAASETPPAALPPPVAVLPKIDVRDLIEPADFTRSEKTPLQKMQAKLDSAGNTRSFSVQEIVSNDGIRIAQINTASGIYCLEERRGHVDFSGINKLQQGMAMKPAGKDCR